MQSTYQHYAQQTPETCPNTDIILRHLTDIQKLCQDTWIRSIYSHYAKTLESNSHTDSMLKHLNPFHQETLCQDTWIQSTYWQCNHTLTYWLYFKLCDSSLHTDTIVSHVTPFYTMMSNIVKVCCNIRFLYMPKSSKRVYLNLTKSLCTFLIYVLLATWLHDSFLI